MIEVEIRGRLTREELDRLRSHFAAKGKHIENHVREMIRLYDYPGFDEDPIKREVDIRLRDTNGNCEIIVKKKADENNVARHELSLKLKDTNLDTAKEVVKALGYAKGLWMHRKKDVYELDGIEWSLVEAPQDYFYFEAEQEAGDTTQIPAIEAALKSAASELGLTVFTPDEYRTFIEELSSAVNKRIEW